MVQADMNIERSPVEHVAGAVMTAFVPKENPFIRRRLLLA